MNFPATPKYRGRLAPSPTGYLHLGHARTFWVAQERARANGGVLILRNEDLDSTRFKMEFMDAMLEDLHWFGFEWSEGPDVGGPCAPYNQSERYPFYRAALEKLRGGNFIYPCTCSRKDIQSAVTAPHAGDDAELIYPGTCRDKKLSTLNASGFRFELRRTAPKRSGVGGNPSTRFALALSRSRRRNHLLSCGRKLRRNKNLSLAKILRRFHRVAR